jgi:hypothetical protein
MANPFGLLGLDPQTDTIADVEHAYRRLALKRNPDKNPDRPEEAQKDFVELERTKEQAIHTLETDTESRRLLHQRTSSQQILDPPPSSTRNLVHSFGRPSVPPQSITRTSISRPASSSRFRLNTTRLCIGSKTGSRRRQKPANSKSSANQRPRPRPNYDLNFAFEPTDFTFRTSSQARSTPPQGESGTRKQEEPSFLRQHWQAEEDTIDMVLSISNLERLITRTSVLSSSRRNFVAVHSAQKLRESFYKGLGALHTRFFLIGQNQLFSAALLDITKRISDLKDKTYWPNRPTLLESADRGRGGMRLPTTSYEPRIRRGNVDLGP